MIEVVSHVIGCQGLAPQVTFFTRRFSLFASKLLVDASKDRKLFVSMSNLVQRTISFFKSVVKFSLKLLCAYAAWLIGSFNFNPMLADFRANWHKFWGSSSSGWFGHREALQTNYNFYVHGIALLLYIPLLWDIICFIKPLFQNHQHKAPPPEKKKSKWAKPKSGAGMVVGGAAVASGSEVERGNVPVNAEEEAKLNLLDLPPPHGEGSSNPDGPQFKRFKLKRRGDGAMVLGSPLVAGAKVRP